MDNNLSLLLNNKYQIKIETKELSLPPIPPNKEISEKEAKEYTEFMNQYLLNLRGRVYKVTNVEYPSQNFLADAWKTTGPAISDIDFELIQLINDFYRNLERINNFIDGAKEVSKV